MFVDSCRLFDGLLNFIYSQTTICSKRIMNRKLLAHFEKCSVYRVKLRFQSKKKRHLTVSISVRKNLFFGDPLVAGRTLRRLS